jgi:hypothetical protein
MQFKTASAYPVDQLIHWMELLLEAEIKLKSSALPHQEILNNLFIDMIMKKSEKKAMINVP